MVVAAGTVLNVPVRIQAHVIHPGQLAPVVDACEQAFELRSVISFVEVPPVVVDTERQHGHHADPEVAPSPLKPQRDACDDPIATLGERREKNHRTIRCDRIELSEQELYPPLGFGHTVWSGVTVTGHSDHKRDQSEWFVHGASCSQHRGVASIGAQVLNLHAERQLKNQDGAHRLLDSIRLCRHQMRRAVQLVLPRQARMMELQTAPC